VAVVVAGATIVAGAVLLAVAVRMAPHAAAMSAALIGLVWWSLIRRKPHVRRGEMLLAGGGAALLFWSMVFAVPYLIRFFGTAPPVRDSEGNLLEPPADLRPAAPTDGFEWFENSAAAGLLAAAGICLIGYGWRTARRRHGRRGGKHGLRGAGERAATTGEQTPVAAMPGLDEPTPATPMPHLAAGPGGKREGRR